MQIVKTEHQLKLRGEIILLGGWLWEGPGMSPAADVTAKVLTHCDTTTV